MKKLFVTLLCLSLLIGAALSETLSVDVDFTKLGAESAIDTLYDMLDAPEDNQGKTARLRGYAYCLEGDGDEPSAYYIIMSDPSSCCGGPQLEFVPTRLPEGFTPAALDEGEVTVTGTLDFGDGYMDVRLVDAAVMLPVI